MATAPNSINYSNQLPLGIEAKSQRRLFFPSTGDAYSSAGSNIIRISLNYDGMLDTALSYLMFDFKNTSPSGHLCRDLGQPEIARLVVSSGGVVLEDIQNYNQLVGSILVPCQANAGVVNETMTNFAPFQGVVKGVGNATAKDIVLPDNGAVIGGYKYATPSKDNTRIKGEGTNPSIPNGETATISYKLVSGLLDNDKYLPLVLMNNGLDIEIHLAEGNIVGNNSVNEATSYEITNVRYVAHLIDLQRDFYDMLRMTQQQSGGVIQLAGQTYRHFSNSVGNKDSGAKTFNIPVRARSIKSIFFVGAPAVARAQAYDLSSTSQMGISEYQVQIGATKYPPTSIKCNKLTNSSEPYKELMKSFGKLGSTIHDNLLSNSANYNERRGANVFTGGNFFNFCPFGIDLETFRAEIENGVDTSSRALPMTLLLNMDNDSSVDLTLHTYALIDSLFFVNMDGSVSVSS